MTTDIVVTTCERLDLLKRTLDHIWERTTTPYRLHIIDDASTEGNAEYVAGLLRDGRIESAVLRTERSGIPSNLVEIPRITKSDPVVFVDDDILCPKLDPDWLARGLAAMGSNPKIGLLALNNPQAYVRRNKRSVKRRGRPVTICHNVGGTFAFIRREIIESYRPPAGRRVPAGPIHRLCHHVAARGYQVGYLTHVYCQHIGIVSISSGRSAQNSQQELKAVYPLDPDTLIPPRRHRE